MFCFFVIFKRRKNVKQWRQAYKQHQLSFDNIRKKPHFNLLSMMDIEKISQEIFFSFYLWLFFRKT